MKPQQDKDSHVEHASRLVEHHGAKNLIASNGFVWGWKKESGVWRIIDDREVKSDILTSALYIDKLTKSGIDSVLDIFKTLIFKPEHEFNIDKLCINCLNGGLYFENDEWVLKSHVRENYSTIQLPVNYDAKAKAPRFEKFLDEIYCDDSDRLEKKILTLEMMGYSLTVSCKYEKFALLIGQGANGKSVLLSILVSLVGNKNAAAVQPNQLDNKFQRAHLHSKLVNVVTEISENHVMADAQLKSIVSGELSTAEHKHKSPFDFRPFCTCWFATNHMPRTRDFSNALFRRALILTFNRTFKKHEQDKHLTDKLKRELPGILNLVLEAFAGVIESSEFTEPKSSESAKRKWQLECDSVAQFVEDKCVLGPNHKVTSNDAFQAYKEWCSDSGVQNQLNQNSLSSRLIGLGSERDRGTGGVRLLKGVGLKDKDCD